MRFRPTPSTWTRVKGPSLIWVLRFNSSAIGNKLLQSMQCLDSLDVMDQAPMGMEFRQDRGPKGGLPRSLESIREHALGKKKGGKGDAKTD